MNFGFKKLSRWKNWTAKTFIWPAQNVLNDFAKSIGHQLEELLLIIIYMNVRDYNCP